jgi:hypothetical protein
VFPPQFIGSKVPGPPEFPDPESSPADVVPVLLSDGEAWSIDDLPTVNPDSPFRLVDPRFALPP